MRGTYVISSEATLAVCLLIHTLKGQVDQTDFRICCSYWPFPLNNPHGSERFEKMRQNEQSRASPP